MIRKSAPSDSSIRYLDSVIAAHKRGDPVGIASLCSAHPTVIRAAFQQARRLKRPALIEATCNQVNQYGGYTGMTPADFRRFVEDLARQAGFPPEQILLGGDHLGPNVWQAEPAAQAMDKARVLARDYALAGFSKIHLDASMRCGDDPADRPLDGGVVAQRAADLAAAAEAACAQIGGVPPRYVIGTEVPPPGGIRDGQEGLRITPPAEVEETLAQTRAAFQARGLEAAWERVVAIVTQPGVEYGDQTLYAYRPEQAAALSQAIEATPFVYEAHSTDYQTREALRRLAQDHFAILKVGPALTFAFREAVFALAMIETEWLAAQPETTPSGLVRVLDEAMLAAPGHWEKYTRGGAEQQAFARKYSLSDRCRYYWAVPAVDEALRRLLANLSRQPIPFSLLSQYLPVQHQRVRRGDLKNEPVALILDKIEQVLDDYAYACGYLR
jgi:D-tagatose-1,6-bisphosphate aldolase subunit GatZ/KbaZ